MSHPKYVWTDGAHIKGDAQVAGEALADIRVRYHGDVVARVIVDESRPLSAPLHPFFEWNDAKAADLFREDQARHIVHSVRAVQEASDGTEPTLRRVYVHVTDDDGGSRYKAIEDVMRDEELRAQVLRRALAEIKSWRARYNELHELAQLFSTVDNEVEQREEALAL